ncbi:MAG: FeoB-associated Cys-rich membrane protein [Peptococcaceae bacterium]|jgi:hypothetical protein|nr:FeoB-associated Cys-rich membrane protein [Peptococcaceae bacterium]
MSTFVLSLFLLLGVGLAVRSIYRSKKNGSACGCGCGDGCAGCGCGDDAEPEDLSSSK